jgi:hypothetical protein
MPRASAWSSLQPADAGQRLGQRDVLGRQVDGRGLDDLAQQIGLLQLLAAHADHVAVLQHRVVGANSLVQEGLHVDGIAAAIAAHGDAARVGHVGQPAGGVDRVQQRQRGIGHRQARRLLHLAGHRHRLRLVADHPHLDLRVGDEISQLPGQVVANLFGRAAAGLHLADIGVKERPVGLHPQPRFLRCAAFARRHRQFGVIPDHDIQDVTHADPVIPPPRGHRGARPAQVARGVEGVDVVGRQLHDGDVGRHFLDLAAHRLGAHREIGLGHVAGRDQGRQDNQKKAPHAVPMTPPPLKVGLTKHRTVRPQRRGKQRAQIRLDTARRPGIQPKACRGRRHSPMAPAPGGTDRPCAWRQTPLCLAPPPAPGRRLWKRLYIRSYCAAGREPGSGPCRARAIPSSSCR